MNRDDFVRRNEPTWQRTEALLDQLEKGRKYQHELGDLPALYRSCCQHLALARQRHYDSQLEARLNRIALRGYHQLYRRPAPSPSKVLHFLANEFPRLVRAHAGYFWLATVLFYGPGIAMGIAVLLDPDAVYTLLDAAQVESFESMYRTPASEERGAEGDFAAFGYYVLNNVSIAFRTFAGGLVAGLGTLFFLVFNGLFLGAVFAHLTHAGVAPNLLSFVIGHGSLELTALVIAGVAGLRLGTAVVAPGRWQRGEALRRAAPVCLKLVAGVAAMLIAAAFLEAFWSSTAGISQTAKLVIGSLAWLAVAAYLTLGGRGGGS
ncbi:MAG: stage II sporulation protein M [Acidobacteriota bacterium]